MNDVLMQQFIQLISVNTGLHIREKDREDLRKKIYTRMQSLKISETEQYYQILNNQSIYSNYSIDKSINNEWQELLILLTTGETYFFRDRGQLSLLKNRIFPEIIERKKAQTIVGTKPSLRIWSAGCSTGEEAYSLAILVKELIPDWQHWDIFVLGTDINPESVAKAQQGFYDSWSFRMVDPVLKTQYFSQQKLGWKINEQIRSMVTFCSGNLLKDSFPSKSYFIHDMDIIICRNVFIYFDFAAITSVLRKFYNTLKPQGYLITGHTELQGQDIGLLQAKVFPESIVYQRIEENINSVSFDHTKSIAFNQPVLIQRSLTAENSSKLNSSSSFTRKNLPVSAQTSKQSLTSPLTDNKLKEKPETVFSQAEDLYHNGEYTSAIKAAEQLIKQYPNYFEAYYLIAEAFANLGNYEQAVHWCQQGIKADNISVKPYYLLANIATTQGNIEQAKSLLKKIIYLIPNSIIAYVELGSIYEHEGDTNKAKKILSTALDLLKELPYNTVIENSQGIIAGELIIQVKKLITAIQA